MVTLSQQRNAVNLTKVADDYATPAFRSVPITHLFQSANCSKHLLLSPLGLNKKLFIHRNHKLETQKQYAYWSVTYRQNDNYTDIYGGKMANCCQKVRGNKYLLFCANLL